MSHAFSGTAAGVGNLIASSDYERMSKVFWELTVHAITTTAVVVAYMYIILYLFTDGMKSFHRRIVGIVNRKTKQ